MGNMEKTEILDAIARMIAPLNPPVAAFESSIRHSPFRILISVLLSSRTRDAVTQHAGEQLFAIADSPEQMAALTESQIAERIYPVGFYRQKARQIKKLAELLLQRHQGQAPQNFKELSALPGVGRKTANLVLAIAFDIPAIAVDIHVFRISQRLGWASGDQPEVIEAQLRETFPPSQWNRINQILVGFGQTICRPVGPLCGQCDVSAFCPWFRKSSARITQPD